MLTAFHHYVNEYTITITHILKCVCAHINWDIMSILFVLYVNIGCIACHQKTSLHHSTITMLT